MHLLKFALKSLNLLLLLAGLALLLLILNFNLELLPIFAFMAKPDLIKNKILRFFGCLLMILLALIIILLLRKTYYAHCFALLWDYSHIHFVNKLFYGLQISQAFLSMMIFIFPFLVFIEEPKKPKPTKFTQVLERLDAKMRAFANEYLLFSWLK